MSYKFSRRLNEIRFARSDVNLHTTRLDSMTSTTSEDPGTYMTRTRMIQIALLSVSVLAIIVGLGAHLVTRSTRRIPLLLIVSFDGLRWDYPEIFHPNMPFFRDFADEGAKTRKGIKPCFVTETFPNHFSIATGLYQESHGIISNTIYNLENNQSFTPTDASWFQNGEPIWVTAKRQGLKTGVYFWISSDLTIRGSIPNYYEHYNSSVSLYTRVDTAISWFVEQNINLGMVYMERPDLDGHLYGVGSETFKSALRDVDATLGYLLFKINEKGLQDTLNVMIISDHGMVNMENKIFLDNYIDFTDVLHYECNSRVLANVFPRPGQLDHLYHSLKNGHPNMTVYKKEDIPIRYHYTFNERIAPLVLLADEGYIILKSNTSEVPFVGYHGYDNDLQNMHAFFAARGPAFKRNTEVDTFNNVDLYPLACKILGVAPAPNNGTLDIVRNLLVRP